MYPEAKKLTFWSQPGQFDLDSLRKHLQAKLPAYAVPTIFYPLEAMPLTPNGKIDKAKLV